MAVYHSPVGLDLNLQHLCVFSIAKAVKDQTTSRTLGPIQRNVLVARRQLGLQGATMPDRAVLLSSRSTA